MQWHVEMMDGHQSHPLESLLPCEHLPDSDAKAVYVSCSRHAAIAKHLDNVTGFTQRQQPTEQQHHQRSSNCRQLITVLLPHLGRPVMNKKHEKHGMSVLILPCHVRLPGRHQCLFQLWSPQALVVLCHPCAGMHMPTPVSYRDGSEAACCSTNILAEWQACERELLHNML